LRNHSAMTALAWQPVQMQMQAVLASGSEASRVDNLDVKWWPDWASNLRYWTPL
jgi:hypothetical protein